MSVDLITTMKPRRRLYFCATFLVIVAIVFLSVVVPDIIRVYSAYHRPFLSLNQQNSLKERQPIFPVVLKRLKVAAQSYFDFSNSTIRGHDISTRHFTFTALKNGAQVKTNKVNNLYGVLLAKSGRTLDDPLAFVPQPDPTLRQVPFPLKFNGTFWNGRSLEFRRPGQTFIKDEQYTFTQHTIQSGGLNITRLSEFSLADRMRDFEWDLYSRGSRLSNIREAGDEFFSRLILLNETRTYSVGEKIAVRVDLFDGFGRARTYGGDDVRIWIRDDAQLAGAAVDVTDLNNGSYLATIPLLFSGNVQVRASLTYPRQMRRVVFYLRNVVKGIRLNAGGFESPFASEATICSPFPFSGGYNTLCNLTSLNNGLSWYCDKPLNPSLKCRHWAKIRDLEFPLPLPVLPAEVEWVDRLQQGTRHHLRLLLNSMFSVKVIPGSIAVRNLTLPCNIRPNRVTWTEPVPKGYIMREQWKPLGCRVPSVAETFSKVNECFRGSTIYMIGDSNLRHMLEMMAYHRLCVPTQQLIGKKNWHSPQLCINYQYSYMVRWRTHALPFHTNADHWADRTNQQAVGMSLDEIPSSGKYIVLLHMYLHFTTHHYSVYAERIKAMKNAVRKLLDRNPQVKVAIRGPHAAFKGWNPFFGGDLQAKLYLEMLKEEFRDMYDRVTLLDFWDYTVAVESRDFHPEGSVTLQMLNFFFAHMCP